MSSQTPLRLGLAALALGVLAACNDTPTQSTIAPPDATSTLGIPTIPNCNVARIGELGRMLLPARSVNPDFDLKASTSVILVLTPRQLAVAQGLAQWLAVTLRDPRVFAALRDPSALVPPGPTKPAAVAELVNLLFACVQLPTMPELAGAYTSGGGVKIIGPAGGTLITQDGHAGIRVPAGAVNGDRLFAIAPLPDRATNDPALINATNTCLPTYLPQYRNVEQYNECYDYTVSQTAPFNPPTPADPLGVAIEICTVAATGIPYGTRDTYTHEHLQIAGEGHFENGTVDPSTIEFFDRYPSPLALNCAGATAGPPPSRVGQGLIKSGWFRLAAVASWVGRPFAPKVALASDGVGATRLLRLSRKRTVYRRISN